MNQSLLQVDKIETVAKEIYGASEVSIGDAAQTKLDGCVVCLILVLFQANTKKSRMGDDRLVPVSPLFRVSGVSCC